MSILIKKLVLIIAFSVGATQAQAQFYGTPPSYNVYGVRPYYYYYSPYPAYPVPIYSQQYPLYQHYPRSGVTIHFGFLPPVPNTYYGYYRPYR